MAYVAVRKRKRDFLHEKYATLVKQSRRDGARSLCAGRQRWPRLRRIEFARSPLVKVHVPGQ
jgi:hypothetical protein